MEFKRSNSSAYTPGSARNSLSSSTPRRNSVTSAPSSSASKASLLPPSPAMNTPPPLSAKKRTSSQVTATTTPLERSHSTAGKSFQRTNSTVGRQKGESIRQNNRVNVYVRVRDFAEKEKSGKAAELAVQMKDETVEVNVPDKGQFMFSFDGCFWSNNRESMHHRRPATQEDVFDEVGRPLVENVLSGYNAAVMAYGQTEVERHTRRMGQLGSLGSMEEGLVPRVCNMIFARAANSAQKGVHYTVKATMQEVYLDDVFDLLNHRKQLSVRNDFKRNAFSVVGAKNVVVRNFKDVLELLTKAEPLRTFAETKIHDHSSRAHTLFTLEVQTEFDDPDMKPRCARIMIADLAGSERIRLAGTEEGIGFEQARNINLSLLALGSCIEAVAMRGGKPNVSIPEFRNSTLTKLLKDFLGGNSVSVMMVTISPSAKDANLSVQTLRFADRAKQITTHAKMNVIQEEEISEGAVDYRRREDYAVKKEALYAEYQLEQTIEQLLSKLVDLEGKRQACTDPDVQQHLDAEIAEVEKALADAEYQLSCQRQILYGPVLQLEDAVCELQTNMQKLRADHDEELERVNAEHEQKIGDLKNAQKIALAHQEHAASEERERQRQRLASTKDEMEGLKALIAQLQSENRALQQKYDDLVTTSTAREKELLDNLEALRGLLEDTNLSKQEAEEKLNEEIHNHKETIEKTNVKLAETEAVLDETSAKLGETEEDLQNTCEKLAEMVQALHETQEKLSTTELTLDETNVKLEHTEGTLRTVSERLADTESQLEEAITKHEETDAVREEITNKLLETEKILSETTEKLEETESIFRDTATRLEETETLLTETNAKLADQEALSDDLSLKIADIETALEENGSKLAETESALEETSGKLAETEAALDESNAKLAETEAALEETSGKLAETEAALDESNAKLAETEAALDESNAKLAETEAALEESNAKLAETEAALEETSGKLTETEAALDESNAKLAETEAALEETSGKLAETEAALDESNAKLAETEAALDESNAKLAETEAALEETSGKLAETEAALDESNAKLAETEAALDESNAKLAETEAALEETSGKLAETEAALDESNAKLAETEAALDESNAKLAETEAALDESNAKLAETEAALDESNAKLAETEAALEETSGKLAETEAALDESNAKLAETEAALDESNAKFAETEAALEETSGKLAETEAALDESNAKLAETEAALEETSGKLAETEAALDETSGKLAETESALDESNAKLVETESALEETSGKLAETEAALEETSRRLVEEVEALEIALNESRVEVEQQSIFAEKVQMRYEESIETMLDGLTEVHYQGLSDITSEMVSYMQRLQESLGMSEAEMQENLARFNLLRSVLSKIDQEVKVVTQEEAKPVERKSGLFVAPVNTSK